MNRYTDIISPKKVNVYCLGLRLIEFLLYFWTFSPSTITTTTITITTTTPTPDLKNLTYWSFPSTLPSLKDLDPSVSGTWERSGEYVCAERYDRNKKFWTQSPSDLGIADRDVRAKTSFSPFPVEDRNRSFQDPFFRLMGLKSVDGRLKNLGIDTGTHTYTHVWWSMVRPGSDPVPVWGLRSPPPQTMVFFPLPLSVTCVGLYWVQMGYRCVQMTYRVRVSWVGRRECMGRGKEDEV